MGCLTADCAKYNSSQISLYTEYRASDEDDDEYAASNGGDWEMMVAMAMIVSAMVAMMVLMGMLVMVVLVMVMKSMR